MRLLNKMRWIVPFGIGAAVTYAYLFVLCLVGGKQLDQLMKTVPEPIVIDSSPPEPRPGGGPQ